MTQVSRAVELVEAPQTPAEVQAFLPRLSRALAGGAPLMAVSEHGAEHDSLLGRDVDGHPALPWDAALVVPTSGSTGDPRLAVLSRGALATSADLTHSALGGVGRWLLALPTTHIAGLQVLVRSLRSRLSPGVLNLDEPFTAQRFADAVSAMDVSSTEQPHYTALVPTQLQRLVDDGAGLEALWRLDAVLVGGAAISPGLLSRAKDAGVTVICTYGMTETCGGCVYDGVPLDGVAVDVDRDGRIRVRGPVLFDGYLGGGPDGTSVDGWFATSDIGRVDDGVLTVEGRADNVLISGGVKIPAEAVERALLELPDIDEAVVVGVSDVEWGERVVAVVTAASSLDEARVVADLRGQILDTWLPKAVIRVSTLPQLASGKADRAAVRAVVDDLAR
ncbi:MAG: AMP-binding protein [Actinomycetes bacterium]